jgi:ABC-type phosphate transport system substrate-binding protein
MAINYSHLFSKAILITLIFSPIALFAQEKTEIFIDGAKFFHPIVEKWVSEYKRENPSSTINLKTEQDKGENASGLCIIAHSLPENKVGNERIVYVGRYALLPVCNTHNPLLEKAAKGLKKQDLINLVFEKDILDEDFDPDEKPKYTATIYTRGSESSTTIALAEYFDQTPGRIKGKKIFGDEIYLLNAVQKDETGITFNTLNYVFDLNSRQLKSEISLVPLHLKSKQKEVFSSLNIDKVIFLLEESRIETIPVENFGLQISQEQVNNKEVVDFIQWVLVHGQKFNHEYGFLKLDEETVASQKTYLSDGNKKYFVLN